MARRKKTAQYVARSRSSSDFVNFAAFIAGMVTTLLVALSIWNYISAPDPLRETLAAIDESEAVGTEALSKFSVNDFDQLVSVGTAVQLEDLLIHLNDWDRFAELSVRVDENLKRALVADQMLKHPLSHSQRNLAIESQISALSAVYAFDLLNDLQIPDIGHRLKAASKLHVENPNLNIARSARLAVLKVEVYDLVKNHAGLDRAPHEIADKLLEVVKDFPNDSIVLANVKLILFSLVGIDRKLSMDIMQRLLLEPTNFKSNQEKTLYRNLQDKVILLENDFESLLNDRWVNGTSGQRVLLETSIQLAGRADGNESLLSGIDLAANWFEQINELDSARQIYQALHDSETTRKNSEMNRLASNLGKKGLSRCNLVGKKLELNGTLIDGTDLDSSTLSRDIVVVIFCSTHSDESNQALADLQYFAKEARSTKKVTILAYDVATDSQDQFEKMAEKYPNYTFLNDSKGKFSGRSLLDQCPVSKVPQALVVNRQGIVIDTNVPFSELESTIDYLVLQQID